MPKEPSKFKSDTSQIKLYQQAQKMEKNSYNFYLEKSNTATTPSQKEIFLKLAEMEKKHMFLLDNLIEFVSRPETWLENTEFNHLDEY